ncbi:MAG: biotin/lipoyl-binding protein [Clostridia bacterium]|nr:biotin/lipoyl-binding protein [Clostridia bacterium]MDD4048098.1 biotin/lipoyl-binding protein [Clostridia bacterium]
MKKFRINVNGKSYEVEVEEVGGNTVAGVSAPVVVSTPVVAPIQAPTTSPAPVIPPKTTTSISANDAVVTAPMPGKIMFVKVKVGQQVNEGDLALTLEAMKMENEIFCSASGTVKEIRVGEGANVNPGDVLITIG